MGKNPEREGQRPIERGQRPRGRGGQIRRREIDTGGMEMGVGRSRRQKERENKLSKGESHRRKFQEVSREGRKESESNPCSSVLIPVAIRPQLISRLSATPTRP